MAEPKILHDIILKTSPIKYRLFLIVFILCMTAVFCFTGESMDQTAYNNLEQGFITPPQQARPQVMWWWLTCPIAIQSFLIWVPAYVITANSWLTLADPFMAPHWSATYIGTTCKGCRFLRP